jgi:hypothetical protein
MARCQYSIQHYVIIAISTIIGTSSHIIKLSKSRFKRIIISDVRVMVFNAGSKKKVVPDISLPKKSLHYFDALNEREIGR